MLLRGHAGLSRSRYLQTRIRSRRIYPLPRTLCPHHHPLHVFVIPGMLIAFIGVHLLMVLKLGINEWPMPGRIVRKSTILLLAVVLGTFTDMAGRAPRSPVMDAWSGDPIPQQFLQNRSALERQGALVFQRKQCHNCHALGGDGGKRGAALDKVAVLLTQDQLIRQVIQGGGNMHAYGKNLSPEETTALVAFLKILHPAEQLPARDASRAVASEPAPSRPPASNP